MNPLGSYEVLFELARGGMGTVELAVAKGAAGVERLVAIKRIRPHLISAPEVVSRFLDEARIISQVHHANVVGLHHASEDERGYYLVFDYVEGETLSGLIDLAALKDATLPLPIVIRIVLDALNGLNAAHDSKDQNGVPLRILHRDVSKQNLIVGRDGVTRLSDFGISKSTLHSTVTNQNYIAGKLIYMPPEYLERAPVDRRMDIYAMGVTFWIAIAGREPWENAAEAHILSHILNDGIPLLSESGVSVPPDIETIIARACQLRATDRFATARQMIVALEDYGKRGGVISSQVEVAEYVESVAGTFLDERRKAIAERVRGTPLLSTIPVPAVGPAANASLSEGNGMSGISMDAHARRIGLWVYASAAIAITALVAGLILVAARPTSSQTPVLAPSAFGPAPLAPGEAAARLPPGPPAQALPSEPAMSASSAAPVRKGTLVDARPASATPPRPARGGPASSSLAPPPAVPTQISTANPYR
jgi:serine/threonine-protein kinase